MSSPTLSLKGRKAFVTGGSGFVGSAVILALLRQGCSVRTLTRQKHAPNLQGLDIDVRHGDLNNCALKPLLEDIDAVFHVAADYRLWARQPQDIYRTNVDGTKRLMHACLDAAITRVVYTSSVATLGSIEGDGVADEETPRVFPRHDW